MINKKMRNLKLNHVKERERKREQNKEKVAAAKREALASCNLMEERYKRWYLGLTKKASMQWALADLKT